MAYGKCLQGKYNPENPKKYKGDVNNIIYRSGYEKKAFLFCDRNPRVVRWNSEEVVIPYWHRATKKKRRYFTDLMIQYSHKDGSISNYICEIKPAKQTIEPKPPRNPTQKAKARFLREYLTYQQNQDKWEAARAFAAKKGMKFLILTEKELGIKR